jgi:hypothetical protein
MASRAALCVLAAALAGCARNDRPTVDVGVGIAAYTKYDAAPYATLYLPYARMAALARSVPERGDCPANPAVRATFGPDEQGWLTKLNRDGWHCMASWDDVADEVCRRGAGCLGGLGFHVWRHAARGRRCNEVAIVFRGTDFGEPGAWDDIMTSLRWLLPVGTVDQYNQVSAAMPLVLAKVRRVCGRLPLVVAVGHSLGGGLAQYAAYVSPAIRYVYAFDPSPVTAYLDAPDKLALRTDRNLGIDRVYESGEILSVLRHAASGLAPPPPCQPYIRIVRFVFRTEPGFFSRHYMSVLTKGLERAVQRGHAQGPKQGHEHGAARLPRGFAAARDCQIIMSDR